MKLISYDATTARPLPFFLAMEEYFAHRPAEDDLFFLWQVEPTVIIGRNQLLEHEVNTAFCRDNGINICRRKSGGGAVYADRNNIMFSHITGPGDVTTVFSRYTGMVAAFLRGLGLNASDTSRNDILIDGQKVSGNAFYHLAGRNIVHGTMLYDADFDTMGKALTPSAGKLKSKGVSSVRSRVTTVRSHLPELSIEEFKRRAMETLCDGTPYHITADDIASIETIMTDYYDPQWLLGRNPQAVGHHEQYIEGVGCIAAIVTTARGRIKEIDLSGDFFVSGDVTSGLLDPLKGLSNDRAAVEAALAGIDAGRFIPGLTTPQLIELIFQTNSI